METSKGRLFTKTKAFLDSNVLLSYIQGEWKTRHLFDKSILRKYHFFTSPIVLQEVLLAADFAQSRVKSPKRELEKVFPRLTIIGIADKSWDRVLTNLRSFRNQIVHSNDYLNFEIAARNCDIFVTIDSDLLNIKNIEKLRFVSPIQILSEEGLHK